MKFKKLIVFVLIATLFSSSLGYVENVYANSYDTYQAPKESDYDYLKEDRSIWIKVAKAAIRTAIKNRRAVVNAVRSISGGTVANQVDRYYGIITSSLSPLLKWADIPAQAVYDAVFRGLVNSGVPRTVATNIALAIREAVSWML